MTSVRRSAWVAMAACALLIIGLAGAGGAAEKSSAEPKVNVGSMVAEIMKLQLTGNQQQLVMWMPFEFFVACGKSQGDTWENSAKELAAFKEYHVVCVMRE